MDVQKVRVRNSNRSSPVFNNCTMHLWWPQVRRFSGKKKFFKVRESQGISLRVRENLSLGKKSGKSEILRVRNYFFPLLLLFSDRWNSFVHFTDMDHVVLVEYCSWNWTTSCVGFSRKSVLFAHIVKELSIQVHCTWLNESKNKWVEKMAVRGGLWNC